MKVLLVASSGGHLLQLKNLYEDLKKDQEYCWVCLEYDFVHNPLEKRKIYFAKGPTNRNLINLIRNIFLAFKVFYKENPSLVISTGAGVAFPFFLLGKILKKKLVFIESYSRITEPSLTGKLLYRIADDFIVQWPELQKIFPKSIYLGKLL